jgi:uncharacterized protein (TIGR03067 family)
LFLSNLTSRYFVHELSELEGIWLPLHAELAGEKAPEMVLARTELELRAGRYAVRFGGEIADEGNYTQAIGEIHATVVLTGKRGTNQGRIIPCIYQLRGDRLRICYGLNGVTPPQFTSAPDAPHYLVTYRRKT